jgi:transcriptional regulator with XRE-family HTH domain
VDQGVDADRQQPARLQGRGFGALLREYRLAAGLTQDALAERAGLSVRGIADLERGARKFPHPATLDRLSDALGLSAVERATFELASRRRTARTDVGAVASQVAVGKPDQVRLAGDARHNLPPRLTSFVGRDRELAAVRRLLDEGRLVTLTGAGGMGKTRLAIEVARSLLDVYPDGVWLVELAVLGQPDLVPQAVASALGLRDEPGHPILETLLAAVGTHRTLIILDNCEHLVMLARAWPRRSSAPVRTCTCWRPAVKR